VKGIKQASPFAQTSCLEGFHSLLNQFALKMIAYSYVGMYCRYSSSFCLQLDIYTCRYGVGKKKKPLQS